MAALAALAVAHLFDFSSFLVMTSRHGLQAEFNPVVVALAQDFGLPGLTIAKIGSVVLLATVVFLLREKYRKVATMVLVIGIVAGLTGGISNVAST
ncbi:MAG: hypothetical protein ABIZ34_10555 [Candidatus Limnocylindrales bacterium]